MTAREVQFDDIDFKRGVIGVAFMERGAAQDLGLAEESSILLSVENVTDPDADNRPAWSGIFHTIKNVLNGLARESYTARINYVHCEVCFYTSSSGYQRLGSQYMISCSIRRGSCVKMVAREFNSLYKYVYLKVREEEQRAIVQFLFAQCGRPYDIPAALSALTWPRKTNGRKWFCSELAFYCLKFISCPSIQSHRADCIDVDELYKIVTKSARVDNSSHNITPKQIKDLYDQAANQDVFDIMFSYKSARPNSRKKHSNGGAN